MSKMLGSQKRYETERGDVISEDGLLVHQQEDYSCHPLEAMQEV
jgi:hypothetical protein